MQLLFSEYIFSGLIFVGSNCIDTRSQARSASKHKKTDKLPLEQKNDDPENLDTPVKLDTLVKLDTPVQETNQEMFEIKNNDFSNVAEIIEVVCCYSSIFEFHI